MLRLAEETLKHPECFPNLATLPRDSRLARLSEASRGDEGTTNEGDKGRATEASSMRTTPCRAIHLSVHERLRRDGGRDEETK